MFSEILLMMVFVSIPLFLFMKPCFFRGDKKVADQVYESEMIEVKNEAIPVQYGINRSRNNSEVGDVTVEQLKALDGIDKILHDMGNHDHGHTFNEAFIH